MNGRSTSVMGVLVGVAMSCGLAIAVVFQATAGQIAENRADLLERAVAQVLPGAVLSRGYVERDGDLIAVPLSKAAFIAGYGADNGLLGAVVPARIMGYQDTIAMLFGYDPAAETLTGFTVLESRETPGLGSKIGTDPAFLASLTGLDVELTGVTLKNPVTLAVWGKPRAAWQVDGITGATVSSSAVIQAINDAAPRFAAVRAALERLRDRPPEEPADER